MIIDCDQCNVRGLACANCAVTFIAGQPAGQPAEIELDAADIRALTALASAGLIPPLRYAPAMAKAS
jgi:ferredoxin